MHHHLLVNASAFLLAGLAIPVYGQQSDAVFADGFEKTVNFRFISLALRDPHVFFNFLGCRDVTDTPLAGFSVNGSLQASIQGDADMDGLYDLSYVQGLKPLDQRNAATGQATLAAADCSTSDGTCVPNASLPISSTYTSQTSGLCLGVVAGSTHPYAPAITQPGAPCFGSSQANVTLNVAGIPVPLRDARVAATYVGSPATSLVSGLLTGFVAESDADATIVPSTFPLVGGQPLSSLLPGGTGNCAAFSDKDVVAGIAGWQFYLNFAATQVQ
jgi:hypothetical protein